MCGLTAIASFQKSVSGGATERVRRGLDAMRHRGPDGEGIHLCSSGKVALGHRLLSVFSRTDAQQPLVAHDGSLAAIVNGEFYNEMLLREQLEHDGAEFRTQSDSELLLHLYDQYGLDCFDRLEGEFAFVLWDRDRRRLIAARDRFGVKPLVWAKIGEEFLLASEAKGLFPMGVHPRWSTEALGAVSVHQYLRPGTTLFEGIREVRPGTALIISEHEAQEYTYFEPTSRSPAPVQNGELLAALKTAVQRRIRGYEKPAFALSGGLDSGTVLALARSHFDAPPDAFGLRFTDQDFDESVDAAATARSVNCNFVAVNADRQEQLRVLDDAIIGSECLAINGQLPAKYLLAESVRAHGYKVILTGEGADELFLGYDHLRQDTFTPENIAYTAGGSDLMLPVSSTTLPHLQRRLGYQPAFLRAKVEIGRKFRGLFSRPLRDSISEQQALDQLLAATNVQADSDHPARTSARLWSQTALAGYILRALGDGTEMSHSIEGRVPFLDSDVHNLSARLEVHELVGRDTGKLALRRALHRVLDESARTRQKRPLVAPPLFWDKSGQLEPKLREVLLDATPDFFCRETLEDEVRALESLSAREQRRAEPSLFLAYCAAVLQNHFNPSWS